MEKVYSGGWHHIMRLTHHWEPDGVGWRSSPLQRRQSLSSPGNNLAVLDKSISVGLVLYSQTQTIQDHLVPLVGTGREVRPQN